MGVAKDEMIKLLPSINSSPKATKIMEGWPKSILLELEGEEGPFFIIIEEGKMGVEEKSEEEPGIIINGNATEIAKVFRGDKDITHPLAHGHFRLKRGKSIELVLFLSRILGAVHRKKLEA